MYDSENGIKWWRRQELIDLMAQPPATARIIFLVFSLCCIPHANAFNTVYKCVDKRGHTTYSQDPCGSTTKVVGLSDNTADYSFEKSAIARDKTKIAADKAEVRARRKHSRESAAANPAQGSFSIPIPLAAPSMITSLDFA